MKNPEKFHSATIPDSRLLQGLLGLRGIAAVAVVLFHLRYLTEIHVPQEFLFIERDFKYGPHLFFVLSAYSLMYSTEHTIHRPDWIRDYLIKRLFRIAPLFYFVLACMLALIVRYAFINDSALPGIPAILLNIFLVFGFFPEPPGVGLLLGGWAIGVEMIFYMLFPVLLIIIKTKKEALLFLLMAVLIGYFSRFESHTQYLNAVPQPKWDWSFFAFLPNLYFFAVGIYAYRLEQTLAKNGRTLRVLIPAVAVLTIGVLLFTEADKPLRNEGRLDLVIWAFGFGALCIWQSAKPNLWSANRFFEYLGERSYSIYLLHPLVINLSKNYIVSLYAKLESGMGEYAYFICALVVMCGVLIVAEITYRAVEVPGIRMGRKLIETMRGTALQAR